MLSRLGPNTVFLDLSLPNEDPFPFIREIQTCYPCTQIIVMSGYVEVYETRVREMGVDTILAKPFQQKDILKLLTRKEKVSEELTSIRRSPRLNVEHISEIFVDLVLDDGIERFKLKKINMNGLGIQCPKNYKIFSKGQNLEFFLKLPDRELLKEKGVVRSILLDKEEVGIEFSEPTSKFIEELVLFLEENPKVA